MRRSTGCTPRAWSRVDRDEKVDGRDRRYYRLTDGGTAALAAETERLGRISRTAATQLAAVRPDLGPATA